MGQEMVGSVGGPRVWQGRATAFGSARRIGEEEERRRVKKANVQNLRLYSARPCAKTYCRHRLRQQSRGMNMAKKPASLLKPDDYEWTWADFDDWNVENSIVKSLLPELGRSHLTRRQKQLISTNKKLLGNSGVWSQRVDAFESLLKQIANEEQREKKRGHYQIRIDYEVFSSSPFRDQMVVPCALSFQGAIFAVEINIKSITFLGSVDFSNVIFQEIFISNYMHLGTDKNESIISIENAKFSDDVRFFEPTIHGVLSFRSTKFKQNISLTGINKCHVLDFYHSNIEGNLSIDSLNDSNDGIIGKIYGHELEVSGNLFCRANIGDGYFFFLKVGGASNFTDTKFKTAPDFRDSKLNRPPEVAGMIVPPPKMYPFKWFNFTESKDKSDVAKYRKLKAMALAANDHEKDGEFFAYEMMAKRGHETNGFGPLLLNSMYWLLSGFGQSIARPCLAMISSWFAFWLLAIGLTTPQMGTLKAFSFSAFHSLFNVVPLIGGLFRSAAMPKGHETWYDKTYHELIHDGFNANYLTVFSTLQQFLGIIFLFLLVLGLRNKFRLK